VLDTVTGEYVVGTVVVGMVVVGTVLVGTVLVGTVHIPSGVDTHYTLALGNFRRVRFDLHWNNLAGTAHSWKTDKVERSSVLMSIC
jgi:hypothetical protein